MLASCPLPLCADQPGDRLVSDTDGAVDGSLLAALARVPDPRSRQGIRHEIGYLLAVIIAATAAAGHDSVAAIAQWAADVPATVLAASGGRADPWTGLIPAPSRQTLGRVLARIEVTRSRAEADAWTRANTEVPDAVAIDVKSVCGAAAGGNHRPHRSPRTSVSTSHTPRRSSAASATPAARTASAPPKKSRGPSPACPPPRPARPNSAPARCGHWSIEVRHEIVLY